MSSICDHLNAEQRRAVRTTEGPILVLAGAGSGKTRVITHRIAYLLERGVSSTAVLAVTFTNKAAGEMAHRVRSLCRMRPQSLTVSTFHSFGAKVLRDHGDRLGYRHSFSIYDEADKQALIRDIAREMGFISRGNSDSFDSVAVAALFSRQKTQTREWNDGDRVYEPLFAAYRERLRVLNSVDFDDLICLPLRLFEGDPEVLEHYRDRYRYVMVDEFQDTSNLQYRLVRALSQDSGNICAVGDDDQSIYSWRGADFGNILQLERDFPTLMEIKLEQNYRSTRTILFAANRLITNNKSRKSKKLWSTLGEGDLIEMSSPEDESAEAKGIAEKIRSLRIRHGLGYSMFGVLVRANSLTRAIEEEFVRDNLPYKVTGGMSFFQRREVKDVLAYLRVLANPDDDVSFMRIVNTPRRGIGPKTIEAIVKIANQESCSLYSATAALVAAPDSHLTTKLQAPLGDFHSSIEEYRQRILGSRAMSPVLRDLLEEVDYWAHLNQENPRPNVARWKHANVLGVVDSLASYEQNPDNINPDLYGYLNRISLITQNDDTDGTDENKVNLMTIHAAKGLEFEVVFVAGVEKDIIPHKRALETGEQSLEEERRLFYVAITRAKRRLLLSACKSRRQRGALRESAPSPFLDELPAETIEATEAGTQTDAELTPEQAQSIFAQLKRDLSG